MRRDLVLAGLAAAGFVAVTAALAAGGPLIDLDLAVYRWSEAHRPPAADLAAQVLNRLGQGLWLLGLCAALAAWLGWLRRRAGEPWQRAVAPLCYVAVAAVMMVPTVLLLKRVLGRGAPSSSLPPERTVELLGSLPPGEYVTGYPGGHAVNVVVWYGVLLVLVTALLRAYGRAGPPVGVRLVVRLAPPVIVLCTTTYLSYHWLTDGIAGLAFGLLVDRLLQVIRARTGLP